MDATLTCQRDLHDNRPLWAASPGISVPARREASRQDYDVVVVGSGISGALVAERLADGRRRILICDRRVPARGSSLASTAMIQHEIDVPLHRLARAIGPERAARVWRASAGAVDDLASRVEALGIDCGFRPCTTLYLAGDEDGRRALATEAEMRRAAGLDAAFLDHAALRDRFALDRTAAILSTPSASANPARMTAGILKAALTRGAELVSPLEITDVREAGGTVMLATAGGRLIAAGHVVFCTGYEVLRPLAGKGHRIVSTWAIASSPRLALPGWLHDHLVWEASDPYLYFRATPDGRLIAGGEDEDDAHACEDRPKGARKAALIAAKVEALTGIGMGEPAYRWAAPFGTTATGLPIIDRPPGFRQAHAVMGFGGNGITFSAIAARLIAAAISGGEDPDAELFRYG